MVITSDNKSKTPPPAVAGYSSVEENFISGRLSKYKNLPYNPKLKANAQKLRKSGNLSEVLFWDNKAEYDGQRDEYLRNLGLKIVQRGIFDATSNGKYILN